MGIAVNVRICTQGIPCVHMHAQCIGRQVLVNNIDATFGCLTFVKLNRALQVCLPHPAGRRQGCAPDHQLGQSASLQNRPEARQEVNTQLASQHAHNTAVPEDVACPPVVLTRCADIYLQ